MTRDEAVAIIKQRMGNNTDSNLDAHIVTEMQQAQIALEQEATLPWFLVEQGTDNMAAGDRTFTPSTVDSRAFLMPFPDVPFFVFKQTETIEDKVAMYPDDYAALWNAYATSTDTYPTARYANDPAGINLYAVFPKPSVAVTVVTYGYFADTVLSSDVTNKWLTYAPEVLMNLTGKIIAGFYTAYQQYGAAFEKMEKEARAALSKRTIVWEENNVRRMMGDS